MFSGHLVLDKTRNGHRKSCLRHHCVSCNETLLSHSTFTMRANGGTLSQTSELEIPVFPLKTVFFPNLLDTVNHVTHCAFPVWWPTSSIKHHRICAEVYKSYLGLYFPLWLLSAPIHSLNLSFYKVFIFVHQIKFFVK